MIVADEPFSALHITMQQVVANQIRPFCTHRVTETDIPGTVPNGGYFSTGRELGRIQSVTQEMACLGYGSLNRIGCQERWPYLWLAADQPVLGARGAGYGLGGQARSGGARFPSRGWFGLPGDVMIWAERRSLESWLGCGHGRRPVRLSGRCGLPQEDQTP